MYVCVCGGGGGTGEYVTTQAFYLKSNPSYECFQVCQVKIMVSLNLESRNYYTSSKLFLQGTEFVYLFCLFLSYNIFKHTNILGLNNSVHQYINTIEADNQNINRGEKRLVLPYLDLNEGRSLFIGPHYTACQAWLLLLC